MRLEFESNTTAIPFVENETVNQSVSSEAENLLREGVKAAQEGRRAEAKQTLLLVTEIEPNNENAWLWLASISEYPEELLVFLNNVLKINPINERALNWKKATQSLLAKTLVQRGVDASKDNRNDFAKQCFEQALEQDAENEMAWLWLASVADSNEEKAAYFEKVLSLNPNNETAQASLSSLNSQKAEMLFAEAITAAVEGNHREAQEMLANVLEQNSELEEAWVLKAHLAGSFEERAESLLKVSALNPENELAKASLASWRMFVEKAAPPVKDAEELHSVPEENAIEEVFAESETDEISNEFSGENEAENQMSDSDLEISEDQEVFAENYSFNEEYAAPDNPTQDLNSYINFEQQEYFEAAQEAEEVLQEITENEAEFSFELEENQANYEDLQDSAVSFEAEESVELKEDLAAEVEAEEEEMNWAFADAPADYELKSQTGEDFAVESEQMQVEEDSADADNEPEMSFEAPEEMAAETAFEEVQPIYQESFEAKEASYFEEAENDEWKDTSPNVFIGYLSQESEDVSTEMQAAESSQIEEFELRRAVEESVSEEVYEVEESQDFAPEAVAESVAEMPTVTFSHQAVEMMLCPFCNGENEKQVFSCGSCQTVLTLTDLETLLNQSQANKEILEQAVESLEREHESYGLNAEQLAYLGIGQINLKNYRNGFMYLQEAVHMNPSNVVLDAQVNALAIRLAEMEKQQSIHDSMPKNCKILVVDDSPTVRKLISGKLEKCGHEVICAVDGLDALEKLNDLTPDLILLDITMPRMDGYQVCKEIRGNEATKDVPVVMISGKDGFFDKVRGRMAGTSGYITKPFGPETLMRTVETYLE